MKYQNIEVIFCDVDGTLTDGRLYYSENGETMKVFHVKDGHGIKNWQKMGKKFCVITARSSNIILKRMDELGVSEVKMGSKNKVADISKWLEKNEYTWNQVAYIGDDINDLGPMHKASFAAAPADAVRDVRESVEYVCNTPGGLGCVREMIDLLLGIN
ncbi:MAG: hypothetical protein ABUK01_10580 [Leptospirales bacterium]